MPKLILFVACQKAIIDKHEDTLSLIGVIEQMNVDMPEDEAVSEGTVAPNTWAIVACYRPLPGDKDRQFEQRTALVLPNGHELLESTVPFTLDHDSHRNTVNVQGFPVGLQGLHTLKLWVRRAKEKDWGSPIAEYPITVTHRINPPASPGDGSS